MAEKRKGQIQIFAKNIKGNARGEIREDAKYIKNIAGGKHIQNGFTGGVNNGTNQPRKEALRVVKIEGPFDENNSIVDTIEKEKWYIYKAKFNREPKEHELNLLKWAREFDENGKKMLIDVSNKGLSEIKYKIIDNTINNRVKIFAYFQQPTVFSKAEIVQGEILLLIGTEQFSKNIANKLMFPAQAVRHVRTKFSNYPSLKVVIFTDGYTEKQLVAITNAIIYYNKNATVVRVNTVDEVINIINSGYKSTKTNFKKRKVKEIYVYSHGYIREKTNEGVIAFGYFGKNSITQELDYKKFSEIDPKIFLRNNASVLYSFSCRTGIGTASETTNDPKKSNSLAQKMSNHGKITVFAYMRRSQYEDTWGTSDHRNVYASDNDSEDSFGANLKSDIKDIVISDPNDMNEFTKYRKKEIRIDNAIWNPEGAYLGVKAGNLPLRISPTFSKYIPE